MKRTFCYSLLLLVGAHVGHASQMHTMAEVRRQKHTTAVGIHWGPENCAELFRSANSGTCVIRTKCDGVDISMFEFAFDCADSSGEVVRHSFGKGGFDDDDEYDTSVQCAQCAPPEDEMHKPHIHHEVAVEKVSIEKSLDIPVALAGSKRVVPRSHSHHEVAVAGVKLSTAGKEELEKEKEQNDEKEEKDKKEKEVQEEEKKEDKKEAKEEDKPKEENKEAKEEEKPKEEKKEDKSPASSKVAKSGPGDCVSTFQNATTGTCMMQTDCDGQDTVNYLFGLVCKEGKSMIRHEFGVDSFGAKETFNTLIKCAECLSLDAVKWEAEKTLPDMVKELAGAVGGIKDSMKNLKEDVTELNDKVISKDEAKKDGKEEAKSEKEATKDDKKEENEEKKEEKKEEEEEPKKEEEVKKDDAEAATSLSDTGMKNHVTVQQKLRGQKKHKVEEVESDDEEDDESEAEDAN